MRFNPLKTCLKKRNQCCIKMVSKYKLSFFNSNATIKRSGGWRTGITFYHLKIFINVGKNNLIVEISEH